MCEVKFNKLKSYGIKFHIIIRHIIGIFESRYAINICVSIPGEHRITIWLYFV